MLSLDVKQDMRETISNIRGIYSSSMFIGPTEAQIDNEIKNIKAAGFNTVYLGVTNNGNGVCWPTPRLQFNVLEPVRDPTCTFTTDYVAYYLAAAKAAGLQVAMWVQCHSGGAVRQDLRDATTVPGHYNMHLPATAQYFADIIQEGLNRYPDFIGVEIAEYTAIGPWGNGQATGAHVIDYLIKTGRDYVTDYTNWATHGWVAGSDTAFQAWLTGAHVQMLTTIGNTVRAVSAAQSKKRFFGLYSIGAEVNGFVMGETPQAFVNQGLIDYVNMPQYSESIATDRALRFLRTLGRLPDSNGQYIPEVPQENIVIGMQLYNDAITASLTQEQIFANMDFVYENAPNVGTIQYVYASHYNADLSENFGGPYLNAAQRAAFKAYFEKLDNKRRP